MIKQTIYASAIILSGFFTSPVMADDNQILYLKSTVTQSPEDGNVGYESEFKINLKNKTLFNLSLIHI